MPPPKEAPRRCLCTKCLETGPGGVLVSAKVHRSHAKKRPLDDSSLEFDPSMFGNSATLPNDIPMETEPIPPETLLPPAALPPPATSVVVRLEVQDIRYQFYSSNLSFTRPHALEFSSRPKVPLTPSTYVYSGLCNQRPYVLSNAPANALFIQQERHLHSWAQRLAQLRQMCPEDDYNNRLQIRSVEKEVISALNKMFTWKLELYAKIGPPGPLFPGQRPVVDTTRFLQIYEEGDPIMARFVWSGLVLVLVLHLLFHTPQAVCDVVLALLHDQVHNLDMLIEEERVTQLLRSIPHTVKGVLSLFDFDPVVTRYLVCPDCYALTPWKASDNPLHCSHKQTPDSPECNAKLVRTRTEHGQPKQRPIKDYFHQGLRGWMGRWICRPHIETTLRRRKAEFKARREREALRRVGTPEPGTPADNPPHIHDILESKAIQGFAWPDGKLWFDTPDDEFRLFFGFTIDGFNPHFNREAKQTVTATGIYLFCLNLPLEERYKPENVYLVGVIPGPDKPSTAQINHYTSLVVDDLSAFWDTGVRFTRTSLSPEGVVAYAAAMPVMCDALGARQLCGYGSVTSTYFCTYCSLPLAHIENFEKSTWPERSLDHHRYWAERWRDAATENAQGEIFKQHGLRYTPLFRLPYFNPITFTIVDTMHNFFLGLLQRHCRKVWGMDLDIEDGDGKHQLRKRALIQPSPERMRAVRRALGFNDAVSLSKCSHRELFYLCFELDIRRGGKKKDLIRELLRWRKRQGAYLPEGWDMEEAEHGPEEAASPIYLPPGLLASTVFSRAATLSFPAEVSAERIEAAESAFARGLKMDGYKKSILEYMCGRRNLAFPQKATKGDLVNMLVDWRGDQQPLPKKPRHEKAVVLGRAVLTAVAEDMRRVELPRWVDPAPIRAGQKKSGKLSADQWRSFCAIHLVVTLIRLWGREPEASRWYQMLTNFLDLVTAVELGSMAVSSPIITEAYDTVMKRYLVNLKRLYKEANIVSNHHLALHVSDFLRLWGPSPHTRGFGWERYNHYLQRIKTNKRFGAIEKTYMYTATRAANLLSLLSLERIRSVVSHMYGKLHKLLNLDARGTRVHNFLAASPDPGAASQLSGVPGEIDPPTLEKLALLINTDSLSRIVFIPTHLASTRDSAGPSHLLHPSVKRLNSFKRDGTTYRPANRSTGDSNVLISSMKSDLGYHAARLENIFAHRRVTSDGIQEEVFCVVRYLKPLQGSQVDKDWFRKFKGVGGSLWTTEYDDDSHLQVVRPSSLLGHFAKTPMPETQALLGEPTYHILPLDRLRARVRDVGEAVMDSEFEAFLGEQHVEDSDVEGDELDAGDMDIDMDTMDIDG